MSLIGLLIAVVIVCLAYWAVNAILRAFGVGDPIATIVRVVFVVLVILWIVGQLGYGPALRVR